MKKMYSSPVVEKINFTYSEQVLASSGTCQHIGTMNNVPIQGCRCSGDDRYTDGM